MRNSPRFRTVSALIGLALLAVLFASCGSSEPEVTMAEAQPEATAEAIPTTPPIPTTTPPPEATPVVVETATAPTATPVIEPTAASTSDSAASAPSSESAAETSEATTATSSESAPASEAATDTTETTAASVESAPAAANPAPAPCDAVAAAFVTLGSANADLPTPRVNATCAGSTVTVTSNQIPDFTYIETSPGNPQEYDLSFSIPATPAAASQISNIARVGAIGVAVNGIPIYGATEGTGGDVMSLGGGFTECGGHNGPTGYHYHTFDVTGSAPCRFSQAEAATSPVLFGYAFDGYPIYSGNFQYTSSWQLTNAALFATDTFSAHTYIEGSGDLDQCNGRTDENGNYAYYTTETFPYTLGCYRGVVAPQATSGGGPGEAGPGGGGPPGGEGGQGGPPPGADNGEGGQGSGAGGGPGGQGPDLTSAAATLGVSVAQLEAALGGPPPDFEAAAIALGVSVDELRAALPAPDRPGR